MKTGWCFLPIRGMLLSWEYKNLIVLYPTLLILLSVPSKPNDEAYFPFVGTNTPLFTFSCILFICALIFAVILIVACHKKNVSLLKTSLIYNQIWLILYFLGGIGFTFKVKNDLDKQAAENPYYNISYITLFYLNAVLQIWNIVLAVIFLQVFIILTVKTVLRKESGNGGPLEKLFSLRRMLLGWKCVNLVLHYPTAVFKLIFRYNFGYIPEVLLAICTLIIIDSIFTVMLIVACHKKNAKLLKVSLVYTQVCLVLSLVAGKVSVFMVASALIKSQGFEITSIIILIMLNLIAIVVFMQVFITLTINTVLWKIQQQQASDELNQGSSAKNEYPLVLKQVGSMLY